MNPHNDYLKFVWRISSIHVIAYFAAGILALYFMDYAKQFSTGSLSVIMRPLESPWIAAGPALQLFRGIVIAVVLYPFKDVFLASKNGWLKLWMLIIGLSYMSTIGPTFGSFEGYLYTNAAISDHLLGIPEMLTYTFLFSSGICYWYKNPIKAWTTISIVLVILIITMSVLGVLASLGIL